MINYLSTCSTLLLVCMCGAAQPEQGIQAIKSLCGCFDVDFRYAETFSPGKHCQFAKPCRAGGTERVTAEESSGKKRVIQHLQVADLRQQAGAALLKYIDGTGKKGAAANR